MVWMPPDIRRKRQKMRLELAYLKIKEKFFGQLSEKDKQRCKEILKALSIYF